jgi:hypothetical protein
VVDLAGAPSADEFDVLPDGTPAVPVTFPGFGYFNPNGSDIDTPDGGLYGPGGAGRDLGVLLGSFDASPTSPTDFFIIGSGVTETLASTEHIYALVNDTAYADNSGSFTVAVSSAPEPASWALMLGGSGLTGVALRRRRTATSAQAHGFRIFVSNRGLRPNAMGPTGRIGVRIAA